jgi:hypothetical protein
MAIGANASHRLLANVAALREADGSLHPCHFLGEIGVIDIEPIKRGAGLDSKRVIRLESSGSRSPGDQRLPHCGGVLLVTEKVVSGQTEWLMAANLAAGAGQCRVLEILKNRHSLPQRLFKDFPRLRSGQMQLGKVMRSVRQLHLFRDQIAVQMLNDLVRHARPRVHNERLAAIRKNGMVDDDKRDDFCLAGGQERLAP